MGNRLQLLWSTLDGGSLELRGPLDQISYWLLGNAAASRIRGSKEMRSFQLDMDNRACGVEGLRCSREWVNDRFTTTGRGILSLGLDQCHQLSPLVQGLLHMSTGYQDNMTLPFLNCRACLKSRLGRNVRVCSSLGVTFLGQG